MPRLFPKFRRLLQKKLDKAVAEREQYEDDVKRRDDMGNLLLAPRNIEIFVAHENALRKKIAALG